MNFKNLKLTKKIAIGTGIPLTLLVGLAAISLTSAGSMKKSGAMVEHTYKVIQDAKSIEAAAVDMETGMRGYLLAGQDQFLDPYKAGRTTFVEKVTELKETVNDNPAQVQLLGEIETTISQWQENVTEPTIALRAEIGDAKTMNDMAALVGEAKGKVYFDRFRQQIATFASREETLMNERRQKATEAAASAEEAIEVVQETTDWVVHTYDVIAAATSLLASGVDMETGMRGYLLAGKDEFLEPYNQGKQDFFEQLAALSTTVNDNPDQVQLLSEIRANIQEWNDQVTEPAIAQRRQVGDGQTMDDIVSLVGEARGKAYFDKFRGQIATFIEREANLLTTRRDEGQAASANVATNIQSLNETTGWVNHTHEVIAEAQAILASAVDMETGMRGYLLAGKDEFLAPYEQGQTDFQTKVDALGVTVNDNPAQVQLLTEAKATINEWLEKVTEPTIALRRQIGDAQTMDDMADLVGEARGKVYFDKFRGQIATFVGRESDLMHERQAAAAQTATSAKVTMIAGTVVAILLGVLMSWFVARSIVRPVVALVQRFRDIAEGEGDLTQRVDQDRKDEVGQLAIWFNTFIDKLESTIREIGIGVQGIDAGASEVASTSQTMATGSAQQASSLEEITSSLEEITSMVGQSADNAQQAANLSSESQTSADNGHKEMSEMNHAMGEIKSSSAEIATVIKVIDDIAFQTNLLALNAAVEAARAGDAGKGFAVVAEEVRNLAQRSAEAAKETSHMIEQAVSRADNGVAIAERVGQELTQIADSTAKVSTLVSEIASAAKEQADGVNQVNTGVSQLDSVVQQNAGNSEELSSAAEETSAQVTSMADLVKQFKVGDHNGGGTMVAARPASHVAKAPAPRAPKVNPSVDRPKVNPSEAIPFDEDEGEGDLTSF